LLRPDLKPAGFGPVLRGALYSGLVTEHPEEAGVRVGLTVKYAFEIELHILDLLVGDEHVNGSPDVLCVNLCL
jgi:hypothetical protein